MLLEGELQPERVISTVSGSSREDRLGLFPTGMGDLGNPYQQIIAPEIRKYIVKYADHLNKDLERQLKQIDGSVEQVMSSLTDGPDNHLVRNTIRDELRSWAWDIKNQHRGQAGLLLLTLFVKVDRGSERWARGVEKIRNYSDLERRLRESIRKFNNKFIRSEGEAFEATNLKMGEINRNFREGLRSTFGKISGLSIPSLTLKPMGGNVVRPGLRNQIKYQEIWATLGRCRGKNAKEGTVIREACLRNNRFIRNHNLFLGWVETFSGWAEKQGTIDGETMEKWVSAINDRWSQLSRQYKGNGEELGRIWSSLLNNLRGKIKVSG